MLVRKCRLENRQSQSPYSGHFDFGIIAPMRVGAVVVATTVVAGTASVKTTAGSRAYRSERERGSVIPSVARYPYSLNECSVLRTDALRY